MQIHRTFGWLDLIVGVADSETAASQDAPISLGTGIVLLLQQKEEAKAQGCRTLADGRAMGHPRSTQYPAVHPLVRLRWCGSASVGSMVRLQTASNAIYIRA